MNQKGDTRGLLDIVIRYLIIFLVGLGNLYVFYVILKPLTLSGVGFVLRLFYDVIVLVDGFMVAGVFFNLVSACVGGAAFYLLFVLIMSCRGIEIFKRVKVIVFAFIFLYVFNVVRIVLMIAIYGVFYFELIHWVVWYFISTLFVVIIWFWVVKLFRIRTIPVYSDFKFVIASLKPGKKLRGRDGYNKRGGGEIEMIRLKKSNKVKKKK